MSTSSFSYIIDAGEEGEKYIRNKNKAIREVLKRKAPSTITVLYFNNREIADYQTTNGDDWATIENFIYMAESEFDYDQLNYDQLPHDYEYWRWKY